MSIRVDSVSKAFGDHVALDDVSLEIPNGSLCALLGPSGGGKSTLLRIIAGLETPDAGAVLLSDRDVTRAPERERGIGFVFQHYAAFKHMDVRDNVAFGLAVRKVGKAQRHRRADELLELVRLGGLGDRYPSQLSGGQRQRMALARALAVEPEVLLLDEPFGALDAQVRQELRDWLRTLHEEVKVTTVFVTHDREEALEVAELVAVLNGGRIEQAGSPDELYDAPETPFVMGFVGPAVQLAGEWVRPHDIDVLLEPGDGGQQALCEHVARLGFEVRVRATLSDGTPVEVQVTRQQADELELHAGQIVWLRPHRARSFARVA